MYINILYAVGVKGTKTQWLEMCIANVILAVPSSTSTDFAITKRYYAGTDNCPESQGIIDGFGTSTTLFNSNAKLDLAAAYGNQTGTVSIDSTHSMNLVYNHMLMSI